MLRRINLGRILVMLFLFSVVVIPASADGVATPTYSISGVMVFTGNDTCTPAPCSEAIAFLFDLQYQLQADGFYYASITNLSDIGTGDLGSFTNSSPGPISVFEVIQIPGGGCSGDVNFISFSDAGFDQFELSICQNDIPAPVVPSVSDPLLYRCATAVCNAEFPENEDFSGPSPKPGTNVFEDVTVTQIPEPTMLLQLTLGLLSLVFLGIKFRKSVGLPSRNNC